MKTAPRNVRRSRWAAIGAAIAVSLGGGGVFLASAAPSAPSSVITIDPVRVLDTRNPVNVGLPGPFVSPVSQKLRVTGSVATTGGSTTAVPAGATGVLLNVTAVGSTADGFISIRPGDATGAPATSNLNFSVNETAPNSVQVALPTTGANAGQIDITYDALGVAGPTTDVLIDVMGYFVAGAAGQGEKGDKGDKGDQGIQGIQGIQGVPGPVGTAGNWGIVNRNTIGSPSADLRSGPSTPGLGGTILSAPPLGTGSLNLAADGDLIDRVSFGNDIDFFGQPFDLTAVGFQVYNVTENVPNASPNMPKITFEIDPNIGLGGSNFSTLTFFPDASLPGIWSNYIDATTTGVWGASGTAFALTPCDINGSLCTWAQLQGLLADGGDGPILGSVAISFGREQNGWHGAVDALQIGGTVYDFEEYGVTASARPAPVP